MGLKDVLRRRERIEVPDGLDLAEGERVLAAARATTGETVHVTTRRFVVSGTGGVTARPWHLVDTGGWQPDSATLRVTWVDQAPGGRWQLTDEGQVPSAFHERVQASVVMVEQIALDRSRRARVVVRKDLATGRLLLQSLYRAGVDPDDPQLAAAVQEVADRLGEQVGLGG